MIPFGLPVLPEVNRTKAALSGRGPMCATGFRGGRDSRKCCETLRTETASPSKTLTVSGDVTTSFAFAFLMMPSIRSWGCEGSKGIKAPPALRIAIMDTMVNMDFLKQTGTKTSGPTPSMTRCCISRKDDFSRSSKVKWPSQEHTAGDPGDSFACCKTRSCTQALTLLGRSEFHLLIRSKSR